MGAPRIRADHELLGRIETRFAEQAGIYRDLERQIARRVKTLESGDWIGHGAQAFYQEMQSELLPSLKRLASAFEASRATTARISKLMRDAEQEAARLLSADGSGSSGLSATTASAFMSGQPAAAFAPDQQSAGGFPAFDQLSSERRRVLENSFNGTVKVTTGRETFVYEGVHDPEAFYAMMQRQHPKELANFLNQTAVLDSVRFKDGRTGLEYLERVEEFKQDRIYVELRELPVGVGESGTTGLKEQIDGLNDPGSAESARFTDPVKTSGHGEYSLTYRENTPIGAQQISFDPDRRHLHSDIDIDYYNPEAGKGFEHVVLEVIPNTVLGTETDPYKVHRILRERGDVELDYSVPDR